jgi:hypothetical protein
MKRTATAEQTDMLAMKDVTPTKSGTLKVGDTVTDASGRKMKVIATTKGRANKSGDKAAQLPAKREEPEPTNMLAVIARAASNPAVNPDAMRAMLDMQKEIMAEQARLSFIEAFLVLKKSLPVITKDGCISIPGKDNKKGQETPYATFEAISEIIDPLLDRHGFILTFATEPSADGSRLLVKGLLDHKSGHQRTTTFPLPAEVSGSKNNVQGWGSTFSYGKRYATIALLNIRSRAKEDRDLNGATPAVTAQGASTDDPPSDKLSAEDLLSLKEKIKLCGIGAEKFCAHYKIKDVADLPPALYDKAVDACLAYAAKKKEAAHNG